MIKQPIVFIFLKRQTDTNDVSVFAVLIGLKGMESHYGRGNPGHTSPGKDETEGEITMLDAYFRERTKQFPIEIKRRESDKPECIFQGNNETFPM